jgi:hypothetical protein
MFSNHNDKNNNNDNSSGKGIGGSGGGGSGGGGLKQAFLAGVGGAADVFLRGSAKKQKAKAKAKQMVSLHDFFAPFDS